MNRLTLEEFTERRATREGNRVLRCGCMSEWCMGWVEDYSYLPVRRYQLLPNVEGPLPRPEWIDD
jgi:hypothetical protein